MAIQRLFVTQDKSLSCPLDVLIYPLNCEAALLHWRIQQELLNQLDDEQCYTLSSFGVAAVTQAHSAPSTDPGVPFADCQQLTLIVDPQPDSDLLTCTFMFSIGNLF